MPMPLSTRPTGYSKHISEMKMKHITVSTGLSALSFMIRKLKFVKVNAVVHYVVKPTRVASVLN